jgi:putative ABC transport system ATP-binding protein
MSIVNGAAGGVLSARRVVKTHRGSAGTPVRALDSVDLDVRAGEFVAVVGPSGSGKTTLLNCCSGLDDVDGGTVVVQGHVLGEMSDDERAAHRARSMGFVFQSFNLVPVLSAVENVELPLLLAGVRARAARRQALTMLERVGLVHRSTHRPAELSGGEQQRVTIARALVNGPQIVWADEPTGALDTENAINVMRLLADLHEQGETIVLVTHDPQVSACADRVVQMRDGRIVGDHRRPVEEGGSTIPAAGA